MTRIVLDAGALIGLERNDRELWAAIKLASRGGEDVLVPSTALAQVWRGTALVAASQGDALYTSDPTDLRVLVAVCGRRRPAIIRC